MNALLAQANTAAAELEDQSKTQEAGSFDNEPPAAGFTTARFIGYVELGKRKQRAFQGADKKDTDEVRLTFELNGSKQIRTAVVDGVEKTFTNQISVKLRKSHTDRSAFPKLFNKMVYGRSGITHMAQMLGEGFIIKIEHNTVAAVDGKPARTYANMKDKDGNFMIQAPAVVDPLTNDSKVVPVPEVTQPLKLLLWNSPTKEMWDSIFIDGTRTEKAKDGTEKQVSKNWLQEDIVTNAVNFEGSALQDLLGGLSSLTLDASTEAPVTAATEKPVEATKAAAAPTHAAAPASPASEAPVASGGDLLTDLGL